MKRASDTERSLDVDLTAVLFGDSPTDRQPYPSAGILDAGMQALENVKNPLAILGIHPDPRVTN